MIDLLIVLVDVTVSQTRIEAAIVHHDQEYTTSVSVYKISMEI